MYRVFSLTWPASMQIYWNKRKRLYKKRVQLPEDWFGKPTWRPFHCFGTPIWPQLRHVKTLYGPCVAMFKVPTQLTITWLIDGKDVHYYVKTDSICLGHLASNACSLQENNVRLISSQSVRTMYCSHTIKRMTYIFPNSHPGKGAPDLKEICIHKRN